MSPGNEAISNEVWVLHSYFKKSWVIGLSKHYFFRCSLKDRFIGFHFVFFFLFRLLAFVWQRFFSLQHIYADLGSWHFLKLVQKKPLVLTVVTDENPLPKEMYRNVDLFVVQSVYQEKRVLDITGGEKPVERILPGVDLQKFSPADSLLVKAPFTLLFCSVPILPEEYEARGLDLLVQLAAGLDQIRFLVLWRPWGERPQALYDRFQIKPPDNLEIKVGRISNMPEFYRSSHATIAPFRQDGGKPYPHSIIESLACGRPVLVSSCLAISEIIQKEKAGEVFEPDLVSMKKAIGKFQKNYADYALRARGCAEKYFSKEDFIKRYLEVYRKLGMKV